MTEKRTDTIEITLDRYEELQREERRTKALRGVLHEYFEQRNKLKDIRETAPEIHEDTVEHAQSALWKRTYRRLSLTLAGDWGG